jgi:hypothetical protein
MNLREPHTKEMAWACLVTVLSILAVTLAVFLAGTAGWLK